MGGGVSAETGQPREATSSSRIQPVTPRQPAPPVRAPRLRNMLARFTTSTTSGQRPCQQQQQQQPAPPPPPPYGVDESNTYDADRELNELLGASSQSSHSHSFASLQARPRHISAAEIQALSFTPQRKTADVAAGRFGLNERISDTLHGTAVHAALCGLDKALSEDLFPDSQELRRSPMHLAAAEGSAAAIEALSMHPTVSAPESQRRTWQHCAVNQRVGNGLTALHMAALHCQPEAAAQLLALGTIPTAVSSTHELSALHAVSAQQLDEEAAEYCVAMLLAMGADVECRSCRGWSPLAVAAAMGRVVLVQAMLQAGADVHATESTGVSALHAAVACGYPQVCLALIHARALPEATDQTGLSPIDIASLSCADTILVAFKGLQNSAAAADEGSYDELQGLAMLEPLMDELAVSGGAGEWSGRHHHVDLVSGGGGSFRGGGSVERSVGAELRREREELRALLRQAEERTDQAEQRARWAEDRADGAEMEMELLAAEALAADRVAAAAEAAVAGAAAKASVVAAAQSVALAVAASAASESDELTALRAAVKQSTDAVQADESKTRSKRAEESRRKKSDQRLEAKQTELATEKENTQREKEKTLQLQTRFDELQEQYSNEMNVRKQLHNQVQDLRGQVRVYCRVRPAGTREKSSGDCARALQLLDDYSLRVQRPKDQRNPHRDFTFDRCFGSTSTQQHLFAEVDGLVGSALDGFNVCIFCYGQTGAGKSFTMFGKGDGELRGLVPRSLDTVFTALAKAPGSSEVGISVMELHQNNLLDLLDEHDEVDTRPKLQVAMHPKGGVHVPNATKAPVSNARDAGKLLQDAQRRRHVSSTKMNLESSRSHMIVEAAITRTSPEGVVTASKLMMVDLAGSERISKSGAVGEQIREANAINKSLTALVNVIEVLSKADTKHVPYRDHKLTMLLSDSLGGNSKTLMVVNVAPTEVDVDESFNSLCYASRAKLIKNNAKQNKEAEEVHRLKQVIKKMAAELKAYSQAQQVEQ